MACENRKGINVPVKSQAKIPLLCAALALFFLLNSCRTSSAAPEAFLENGQSLPFGADAQAYITADVKKAMPIIEFLPFINMKDRQTARIVEKTDFLVAAIFPSGSDKRFHAAATGDYPSARAWIGLSLSKDWKKRRSKDGSFWYSRSSGVSLSLESKRAFIVSSRDKVPINPVVSSSGARFPEGFTEFSQRAPVSCWLADPASLFDVLLTELPFRFPARELFLNLYVREDGKYEGEIRIQFENAQQARGAASIMALASAFIDTSSASLASIILSNPPALDGKNLDLKTNLMSKSEIYLLFQMFLLYLP